MTPIKIDIVCPIYKHFEYLEPLYNSFFYQENVIINKIVFPVTDSGDEDMEKIRNFIKSKENIISFEVKPGEFSHSLTREKAIKEYCESKCVVMISQDIKLTNNQVFYNLVKDIDSDQSVYNFARQICTNKSIEKYIREKNYPKESYLVTSKDVEKMQLMAYFASDACSAYNRDIFLLVGGYGGYNLMMNEDMLYSKIILDKGYCKKYCADAIVDHSHKYKLKQLYRRYYDTGVFYAQTKLFDNLKSTSSGLKLSLYVLKRALMRFDIPVLFRWFPDMTARYLGMKKGKKEGKRL